MQRQHEKKVASVIVSDDLVNRVGGRFKLTSLIMKRAVELSIYSEGEFARQPDKAIQHAFREVLEGQIYLASPQTEQELDMTDEESE